MFNTEELFVVLVLYNMNLKDSETYKSIILNNKKMPLKGVIFDNSPKRRNIEGFEKMGDFQYYHDENNPGLAVAYNYALKLANCQNCKWLLLLDQDTFFTEEYFNNLKFENQRDIVLYAPIVKSIKGMQMNISPSFLNLGGFKAFTVKKEGQQFSSISGITSGTVVSCDFIQSLGGFNSKYPLDMLDHWYYREVYRRGKYASILNSIIYQNLSVNKDFEKNVSVNRYSNFVTTEHIFFKTDSTFQYIMYKFRLIFRLIKQLKYQDKKYYKITLKSFFYG